MKSDLPPARMRRSGALVILAGIFVLLGTSLLVMEKSNLVTRVAASAVILLSTGLLIGRLRTIPEATSASDRLAEINRNLEEELNRTRDQHRQLDHYFEMLMANVPANIYFKDRESRFLRVNQSMATYVKKGHPRDLIGKTDHDLFGREHADPARADELRIINTGTAITGLLEREVFP
ncbi:MAG TPA: PAS domain-containing protein, partial [Haloferula sp.]